MSDRYGYGDGRESRDDDLYNEYGNWHSRRSLSNRSSSGAGAYSNRSTQRRSSEDYASYSDSRYSSSNRTSRSASTHSGRTSQRSTTRRTSSNYDHDYEPRSSSRRSSALDSRSASHRTSGSDQHARSSRASERDQHPTTRHRSTEPAASRYSRSSYGSRSSRTSDSSSRAAASSQRRSASNRAAESHDASSVAQSRSRVAGAGETLTPKKSRKGRNIAIVAAVIVGVLLIGAVSAFAYINSITSSLHEGVDQDLRAALVETDMANEPFYMLLLGTDKISWREGTEDGGVYRSDAMILARVDAPQGTISLISIPRDTLVDMGQNGWQKINAAYGLGGPSYAVEMVSKLTGVDISHYAEVDMDGLSAIVDAIGGVEVEVPLEIDDEDAGGYVPAGWQTLDGEHALIVCRSRNSYVETAAAPDLMRAANQRMVLSAIAHKVLGSDVATIANTVRSAANYITTDLELNDIIGLAQALQGMNTDDSSYTASLPTRALYIANGYGYPDATGFAPTDTVDPSILEGWYGVLLEDEWSAMRGRMSEGKPPAEGLEIDEATGTVLSTAGSDASDISSKTAWITIINGTDREGLATRVMGMLNAEGFENITIEDAMMGYDYPETLVIYDESGRAHEAEQLVEAMGQGRAMLNDGNWIVSNNFLIVIGEDWKGSTASSSSASASASSASASSGSA